VDLDIVQKASSIHTIATFKIYKYQNWQLIGLILIPPKNREISWPVQSCVIPLLYSFGRFGKSYKRLNPKHPS
jgi:hypothetical protein